MHAVHVQISQAKLSVVNKQGRLTLVGCQRLARGRLHRLVPYLPVWSHHPTTGEGGGGSHADDAGDNTGVRIRDPQGRTEVYPVDGTRLQAIYNEQEAAKVWSWPGKCIGTSFSLLARQSTRQCWPNRWRHLLYRHPRTLSFWPCQTACTRLNFYAKNCL